MPKTLTLKRIACNADGTFGVLLDGSVPFAVTCEREWLDNRPDVSCIPKGTYICRRVNSPKFGDTFEVTGVQGRTSILLHSGNTEDDSHGCVLVGEQFGTMNNKTAVLSSKVGFAEFLQRLEGENEFTLIIKEV